MGIKKLDTIWIDGSLVPWDQATDHLLAHTMHYGVGAFEGIRAYQRADGRTAIFRLREHIERLLDSCLICTIDCPYGRDPLMAACAEGVRASRLARTTSVHAAMSWSRVYGQSSVQITHESSSRSMCSRRRKTAERPSARW